MESYKAYFMQEINDVETAKITAGLSRLITMAGNQPSNYDFTTGSLTIKMLGVKYFLQATPKVSP